MFLTLTWTVHKFNHIFGVQRNFVLYIQTFYARCAKNNMRKLYVFMSFEEKKRYDQV